MKNIPSIKMLNILFPQVEIEPTTRRIYSHTIMPLRRGESRSQPQFTLIFRILVNGTIYTFYTCFGDKILIWELI